MEMTDYQFTQDWFAPFQNTWRAMIEQLKPRYALEIGAFEGRATVFMAEQMAKYQADGYADIIVIDPWMPGQRRPNGELFEFDMIEAEALFRYNCGIFNEHHPDFIFDVRKGTSAEMMPEVLYQILVLKHFPVRDLIYVDGAHDAASCLHDMVMGFQILAPGGVMVVDDYLWRLNDNPAQSPKLAIDTFTNVYREHMDVLWVPDNMQVMIRKRPLCEST